MYDEDVTPKYKRRRMVLKNDLDQTLFVTMWGEHASTDLHEGQKVTLQAAETHIWKNECSLNTTSDTKIQVTELI